MRAEVSDVLSDPRLRLALVRAVGRRIESTDIEDVVQSTLAEAVAASPRLPGGPDDVRRIVFSIARQKVVDWYRRRGRERRFDLAGDLIEEAVDPVAPTADLLRWATGELPSAEAARTFEWLLREGDGETLAEIAESDQLPAPVVRKRVSRLRQFLRERWANEMAAVALLGSAVLAIGLAYALRSKPEPVAVSADPSAQPGVALAPSALTSPGVTSVPHSSSVPQARSASELAAQRAVNDVDLRGCQTKSSPSGSSQVWVEFASDGRVRGAKVDSGVLLGRPEASCVLKRLEKVKIAPSVDLPVRVERSVDLFALVRNCDPPFYVDAQGLKHCKAECLTP